MYYYAHETNTLLEKSKHVATTEDLTKIKSLPRNTDIIESCTKEQANNKRKFWKLTNFTIFAALLKEVPRGCKNTVLPHKLLKNPSVKCSTFADSTRKPYIDNSCLLRALTMQLHGNEKLEEKTFKLSKLVHKKTGETDPANFRSV